MSIGWELVKKLDVDTTPLTFKAARTLRSVAGIFSGKLVGDEAGFELYSCRGVRGLYKIRAFYRLDSRDSSVAMICAYALDRHGLYSSDQGSQWELHRPTGRLLAGMNYVVGDFGDAIPTDTLPADTHHEAPRRGGLRIFTGSVTGTFFVIQTEMSQADPEAGQRMLAFDVALTRSSQSNQSKVAEFRFEDLEGYFRAGCQATLDASMRANRHMSSLYRKKVKLDKIGMAN